MFSQVPLCKSIDRTLKCMFNETCVVRMQQFAEVARVCSPSVLLGLVFMFMCYFQIEADESNFYL